MCVSKKWNVVSLSSRLYERDSCSLFCWPKEKKFFFDCSKFCSKLLYLLFLYSFACFIFLWHSKLLYVIINFNQIGANLGKSLFCLDLSLEKYIRMVGSNVLHYFEALNSGLKYIGTSTTMCMLSNTIFKPVLWVDTGSIWCNCRIIQIYKDLSLF